MGSHTGSLLLSVALVTASLWFLSIKTAHAYIDPGSVSFLIQMLLAFLFASLFGLKMFWHRLTGGVARLVSRRRRVKDLHGEEL